MSTEKPTIPPTAPTRSFLSVRRDNPPRLNMLPPTWQPAPHPTPANPKKYFSASRNAFLTEEFHGANLPPDAIEITHDEWHALLEQNSQGKQIVAGHDGKPVAVDQVVTPAMKRQLIEAQIDAIRRAPTTLDAQRGTLLGKTGAKEQLATIDAQIDALRATIPPLTSDEAAAAPPPTST